MKVIAKDFKRIYARSWKNDPPTGNQVMKAQIGKGDLAWGGFRNFDALFVIKADIDLVFPVYLLGQASKGHEISPKRIAQWAKPLKDSPQVKILGQNILINGVAAKKA